MFTTRNNRIRREREMLATPPQQQRSKMTDRDLFASMGIEVGRG